MLGACLCLVILAGPARPAGAHGHHRSLQLPTRLVIKEQNFDASMAGFRAYLETIKYTDVPLHTQLSADLDRLASRGQTSRRVLLGVLVLGLASTIYAIVGRKDCPEPSIGDPAFGMQIAARHSCDQDNMMTTSLFGLMGVTAIGIGGLGALATMPGRAELFDLVNRHNRLNPEPLRLQLGYDPVRRTATAGAAMAF